MTEQPDERPAGWQPYVGIGLICLITFVLVVLGVWMAFDLLWP